MTFMKLRYKLRNLGTPLVNLRYDIINVKLGITLVNLRYDLKEVEVRPY